jgi:voltage-gated potassium channel
LCLRKIFINPVNAPRQVVAEAYSEQIKHLKKVWNEKNYGLERLVRLFLCLAQFFYPILLIRDIFGRFGGTARRLAVETYAIFKFVFPLAVIWSGWYRQPFVVFLIVYFLSETLVHIFNLIFLSDIHFASVSYPRALLLILLHYAEVIADFAVFYLAYDFLSQPMDAVSALYFSVVSTTTVGFGDITAKNSAGQLVVSAQLLICVVFIIVFINYFSQRNTQK